MNPEKHRQENDVALETLWRTIDGTRQFFADDVAFNESEETRIGLERAGMEVDPHYHEIAETADGLGLILNEAEASYDTFQEKYEANPNADLHEERESAYKSEREIQNVLTHLRNLLSQKG